MAPTHIVGIPDSERNLDEFDTEETNPPATLSVMDVVEPGPPSSTAGPPPPLSRPEAARLRRPPRRPLDTVRRVAWQPVALVGAGMATCAGYLLALCAFAALRCDSFAAFVERTAGGAALRAARHAADLMRAARASVAPFVAATHERSTAVASRHAQHAAQTIHLALDAARARWQAWHTRPAADPAMSKDEWEGALVAVAVGVVAFAYGGLLVASWRTPGATTAATPALAHASAVTSGETAPDIRQPVAAPLEAPQGAAAVQPRPRLINASTFNAIWRRNDTRSLQRAFDNLRRETLALHHCGMQMTATDRAVARCDSNVSAAGVDGAAPSRRVRWTIEFRRTGNRWAIQRVSTQ